MATPIIKGLEYQRLVDEARKTDDPAAAALEPVNALLRELSRRRNLGVEYRLEELATRYGVAPETAREWEATLEKSDERYEIALQGGIADYRPPPPEVRRRMAAGAVQEHTVHPGFRPCSAQRVRGANATGGALLAESRAAGLDVEAATGGGAEDLSLELLPRLLEDLFFAHWQAENATVLTYTLCLLHHGGAAPQRVSDYAAEVLRIFWQVLLPDKADAYIRGFIEKYALFCWEVLEPLGVVEIEGAVDRAQASRGRFPRDGRPAAPLILPPEPLLGVGPAPGIRSIAHLDTVPQRDNQTTTSPRSADPWGQPVSGVSLNGQRLHAP